MNASSCLLYAVYIFFLLYSTLCQYSPPVIGNWNVTPDPT